MNFEIGYPIVHPIHGAGILRDIEKKQIRGKFICYYVIDFPFNDLEQVMVPVEMAEKVGLRQIMVDGKINGILSVLGTTFSESEEEESKSFHQRYREYLEKVQSGDLKQVASVYRLLFHRSLNKPLGTKDKALFETARQILISEVVFSKGIKNNEAKIMIDEAMEDIVF